MQVPFSVVCADVALFSRVDHASMTTQSLMELLVSDISNISRLKDANGDFLDIEEWNGVSVNAENEVDEIVFAEQIGFNLFADDSEDEEDRDPFVIGPGGSINLRWLPLSVTIFEIYMLRLNGTIKTSELPRGMQSLDIAENKFTGTFDMGALPLGLSYVSMHCNRLEGSLDMKHAPPSLRHFDASSNIFSGSLDLSELPSGIHGLYLSSNNFSGGLDLSKIPCGIKCLHVNRNYFSQDKLIVKTPTDGFKFSRVDRDKFTDIVDENGNEFTAFR